MLTATDAPYRIRTPYALMAPEIPLALEDAVVPNDSDITALNSQAVPGRSLAQANVDCCLNSAVVWHVKLRWLAGKSVTTLGFGSLGSRQLLTWDST